MQDVLTVAPMRISKSKFMSGRQCLKRLHLQIHQPELAAEPDAAKIEPRPKVSAETLKEVMRLAQTRGGGKTTDRWAFVANQRPYIDDEE
jgi:hypothetical protein